MFEYNIFLNIQFVISKNVILFFLKKVYTNEFEHLGLQCNRSETACTALPTQSGFRLLCDIISYSVL